MTPEFEELRRALDELDAEIVTRLARRLAICESVAQLKKREKIAMMQPQRVETVKRRNAARGESLGLRGDFVVALYEQIIAEACRVEDRIIAAPRAPESA